jgi:hypothetical protein
LLNSQLLQVLFEFIKTQLHLVGCWDQLFLKFSFKNIYFSVFKVLNFGLIFSSSLIIFPPVLNSFFLPIFHELLVLFKILNIFLTLILLQTGDEWSLSLCIFLRLLKQQFLADVKASKMSILKLSFVWTHVFATLCFIFNRACQLVSLFRPVLPNFLKKRTF